MTDYCVLHANEESFTTAPTSDLPLHISGVTRGNAPRHQTHLSRVMAPLAAALP